MTNSGICFITIGSELLNGRTVNTNLSNTGKLLRKQGLALTRSVSIPDTREAITTTLRQELAHSRVVLISGGLGPTNDDITKQTLADFFDSKLVSHEPTLELLKAYFAKRGRELTPRNQAQALVPDKCEVLFNPQGSAPGMLFRQGDKIIISMPGVPTEMLYMMEHLALPILIKELAPQFYQKEVVRLFGIAESNVADMMKTIEGDFHPAVDAAYYPSFDGISLELSISGPKEEESDLSAALIKTSEQVQALLGRKVYATGSKKLEALVADYAIANEISLAVAESMTGGLLSKKIVSLSGVSAFFKGGVTAYQDEIKQQVLGVDKQSIDEHTAVSEQVAKEMAQQIRLKMDADIGLSTTGYAEASKDQLAMVWIACANKDQCVARRVQLFNNRNMNQQVATNAALLIALKMMKGKYADKA